jgi:hypothetical protein
MKKSNVDIAKLKRDKYSKPENKFKWLYSALVFGKAKKVILNKKAS